MSIPAACRCTISRSGSSEELNRRSSSLRCARLPLCSRSYVDLLRFAMTHSRVFGLCHARLGWRSLHKLSDGVGPGLAADRGEPDDGSRYYQHWLSALESLVADKGLTDSAAML